MATLEVRKGQVGQAVRNESALVFRAARSVALPDVGVAIVTADSGTVAPGIVKVIKATSIRVALRDGITTVLLPEVYGQELMGESSYVGAALVHWL